MRLIAGLAALFFCGIAQGAEYLKPRNLNLDVGGFTSQATREPYLNTPKSGALYSKLDLNWDVDLACGYYPKVCFYWDNTIHSLTGQNRFRYVSWEFRSGLDFGALEVFYYHHSEHSLDEVVPDRKFPVADAYMVRVHFLRGGR